MIPYLLLFLTLIKSNQFLLFQFYFVSVYKNALSIFGVLLFLYRSCHTGVTSLHRKSTTQNGLSRNYINDLSQDDNGFLWIATSDGLDRFNGTEVVQYFHAANKNSLAHNYVYCLKITKQLLSYRYTGGALVFMISISACLKISIG